MNTSQAIWTPAPRAARYGTAATVAIAIVAGSTVVGLAMAAITFGALAIAFSIAVPIAPQYQFAVSANDVLIAERFAAFWWVFAGASIMSVLAAIAVIVTTVRHFESPPAGSRPGDGGLGGVATTEDESFHSRVKR